MPEKESEKERTHNGKEGRRVFFFKLKLLAQMFYMSSVDMTTYKIRDRNKIKNKTKKSPIPVE